MQGPATPFWVEFSLKRTDIHSSGALPRWAVTTEPQKAPGEARPGCTPAVCPSSV